MSEFNIWKENCNYKRGSIVFIFNEYVGPEYITKAGYVEKAEPVYLTEWYVCKVNHSSCNMVFPNKNDDYYWEYIQNQFIDYITQQGILIGNQQNAFLDNGMWDVYTPKNDNSVLPITLNTPPNKCKKSLKNTKNKKEFYCLSNCVETCNDCKIETDVMVLEKENLKVKDGYIDCLIRCENCFVNYFETLPAKRKIYESELDGVYYEEVESDLCNGKNCVHGENVSCIIYKVTNAKNQIIFKNCKECVLDSFLDTFYKEEIIIEGYSKNSKKAKPVKKIEIPEIPTPPVRTLSLPSLSLPPLTVPPLTVCSLNTNKRPPGLDRKCSKSDTESEIGLKRKIKLAEEEINNFKKQKTENNFSRYDKILLLDTNIKTRNAIIEKYNQMNSESGSDYEKSSRLLNSLIKLPFNKKKEYNINLETIKEKLDDAVWGQKETKDEILQFFAKKISNPNSKGQILALHGAGGTGKTKIIRDGLAKAIGLPFFQINCGGLSDVNVLTGHSSTYVGSKPGKFVDILIESGYSNPIIYLDELDKISEYKMRSIYGILTHIFDEDQNSNFQDNYFGNVDIDLSNVLFVVSFNDKENISPILLNRLRIIEVPNLEIKDKLKISLKMIEEIKDNIWGKNSNIKVKVSNDNIEYLLNKLPSEKGVRTMKKSLERILENINMKNLLENKMMENIEITREIIDGTLNIKCESKDYLCMYS
jgi:hypothetical protein